MGKIVNALYTFDSQGFITQKPPILIVTNLLGGDPDRYLDIARLCGCKLIHKYIDPRIQEEDIKKGLAPTPETIHTFAGFCELVEADVGNTKFVNPKDMYTDEIDEEGNPIPTVTFKNMTSFLESELEDMKKNNVDIVEIAKVKKRLQSLKANMIDKLAASAMYYSIGNYTLPKTLLYKKEAFTEQEKQLIKKASINGATIVEHIIFNKNTEIDNQYCYEITKYYTERYDGKGYPEGMAGENIPI